MRRQRRSARHPFDDDPILGPARVQQAPDVHHGNNDDGVFILKDPDGRIWADGKKKTKIDDVLETITKSLL
jgi:hypothetical protein